MISKKKRSSPKFRAIFLAISQVQTFEAGLFSYGGGYFPFFTENRPQTHKKHAFLHTSQANGGGSSPPPPPPPWLRYWKYSKPCLASILENKASLPNLIGPDLFKFFTIWYAVFFLHNPAEEWISNEDFQNMILIGDNFQVFSRLLGSTYLTYLLSH